MRPTNAQLQQLKLFFRQQSVKHGSGVVAFNHGSAAYVPLDNLHTLPADRHSLERLIAYANSRQSESFVIVADNEPLIATNDATNHNYPS